MKQKHNMRELKKRYSAMKKFFGESPTVEAVMESMKLTADEAADFLEKMQAPKKEVKAPTPPKKKPEIPVILPVEEPMPTPDFLTTKQLNFIRGAVLFFAVLAFALSCFFGIDALAKRQPIFIAIIMGTVLIGFGRASAQVAVYKKRLVQKDWWIFAAVWAFTLIYSINSTTYSFYDRWVINQEKSNTSVIVNQANRALLDSYEKEENEKNIAISDKRKRLSVFQATIDKYLDPTLEKGKEYNTAVYGAIALEKEIDKLDGELKPILDKKRAILAENPEVKGATASTGRKTYYSFIAGIFKNKFSSDGLQFIVDLIPAIIFDIICDLGLYVFLFLEKIQAKKKE